MNTFITTQPLVDQLCGSRLGSINWEKNVVPDLAERWDISKDSQTYTFYLRKGLKWDDGQPLTAEDVEWTYTMGLNPKTASWVGGQFSDVAGSDEYAKGTAKTVSGIKVIDPLTIQIQLKQPSGVWLFRECFLTVLPMSLS